MEKEEIESIIKNIKKRANINYVGSSSIGAMILIDSALQVIEELQAKIRKLEAIENLDPLIMSNKN